MSEGRFLGVDLGGTKTLAVVFDVSFETLASRTIETRREDPPERILARLVGLIGDLRGEHRGIEAVGVGFAGLVDHVEGVVDGSVILTSGWDGFPLRDRLSSELDLPCVVDNDATAAGVGEYFALGRPAGLNLVLLTLGTGIGGALVLGGALHRGATNSAGEFGNTTIDWCGEEWASGNAGALNTFASGLALARRAEARLPEHDESSLHASPRPLTAEAVGRAAGAGDPLALAVLDEGARALGAGIANLLNLLDPDRVALMGGLCRSHPSFVDTARREAMRRAFQRPARHAVVAPVTRGEVTGALGAAVLAAEREGRP